MAVITIREALKQALREEMIRDERVFLMGEDIGPYGGAFAVTKGLYEEFGEERVRDTPIAEGVIAGAAMGAAVGGQRPVAEIMTINFALLTLDQMVNHAAKMHHMFGGQWSVPMVLRMAAGWGQLSATHSQTLEVLFAHFPGMKVVFPGTPYDSKGMLKAAIRDLDPVIFIEHTSLYGVKGEVPEGDFVVPIGKSDVKREGKHCTIVTYGRMLQQSLEAAKTLASDGVEAEIVDLRTLRPLDIAPVIDVGEEDQSRRRRHRRMADVRRQRRNRRAHFARRLRRSRRAGGARGQQGSAAAVFEEPGTIGAAVGQGCGGGSEGDT